VDQSKSPSNQNFDYNTEILLTKYYLPFWRDNGTQLDSKTFKGFSSQVGINLHFASVQHLESNELVERVNGIILLGISKPMVDLPKGKWVEEMTKVVWNHNTSVSHSIGFTPFKLLFGGKTMYPEEVNRKLVRVM
jgi:transposase InsO family protein